MIINLIAARILTPALGSFAFWNSSQKLPGFRALAALRALPALVAVEVVSAFKAYRRAALVELTPDEALDVILKIQIGENHGPDQAHGKCYPDKPGRPWQNETQKK